MNAFKDLPWEARFGSMGDEAEQKFEEVYPKGWVRWGLNRPPVKVSALPPKIRYAPDYLTSDGFIEVMGVGKDQILKVKLEKHLCLWQWHHEMPTQIFVWDSENKRYTYIAVPDLHDIVRILESFPEGKPYWAVQLEELGSEWKSM